jgi:hypothetical protein
LKYAALLVNVYGPLIINYYFGGLHRLHFRLHLVDI